MDWVRDLIDPNELMMPNCLLNQMILNVPNVEKSRDSIQIRVAEEGLSGGVPSAPLVGILGEMITSM